MHAKPIVPSKRMRTSTMSLCAVLAAACASQPAEPAPATTKRFRIPGPSIQRLVHGHGSCIASDRILLDG